MDAIIYNEKLMELMQLSKNRFLIQNLARKQNPGKLEYELGKLKKTSVVHKVQSVERTLESAVNSGLPKTESVVHKVQSVEREVLKVVRNEREIKFDDLPARLQKLWNENRDAYKKIRALHEKLKLMEKAAPEDRQQLTERVFKLDEQIRENWKVIDAWEPGQEKPKIEIDHKRINSNRKFISTNIKQLMKLEGKKAAALREKLQLRVDELVAAGEELKEKTKEELRNAGIII